MLRIFILTTLLLGGCTQTGQMAIDQSLAGLLARCGGDIIFGGVAITGHITCPVPKQ